MDVLRLGFGPNAPFFLHHAADSLGAGREAAIDQVKRARNRVLTKINQETSACPQAVIEVKSALSLALPLDQDGSRSNVPP
jgi:hypothetical protein